MRVQALILSSVLVGICGVSGMTFLALAQTNMTGNPQAMSPTNPCVSSSDLRFLNNASQGNVAEIQISNLAINRSRNPQLVQVANQLVSDRAANQTALMQLAQTLNVSLRTNPNAMGTATYQHLSGLSGAAFDQAYLNSQYSANLNNNAEFNAAIQSTRNPSIRSYAQSTLSSLTTQRDLLSSLKAIPTATTTQPRNVSRRKTNPMIERPVSYRPSAKPYRPSGAAPMVRGYW